MQSNEFTIYGVENTSTIPCSGQIWLLVSAIFKANNATWPDQLHTRSAGQWKVKLPWILRAPTDGSRGDFLNCLLYCKFRIWTLVPFELFFTKFEWIFKLQIKNWKPLLPAVSPKEPSPLYCLLYCLYCHHTVLLWSGRQHPVPVWRSAVFELFWFGCLTRQTLIPPQIHQILKTN